MFFIVFCASRAVRVSSCSDCTHERVCAHRVFVTPRLAPVTSLQYFKSSKLTCYRILSTICAIPCAIYWGLTFACISFCHIWCLAPWLKALHTNLHCTQQVSDTLSDHRIRIQIIAIVVDTFIKPIVDVLARLLSAIHVTHAQGKPRDPSKEDLRHNGHVA